MNNMIQVRDYDCHHYMIPEALGEDFNIMLQAIDQCEWGTDGWYDANDNLADMFGKYMVG